MLLPDKNKTIKVIAEAIDWLNLAVIFLVPVCFAMFYEVNSVFVLDKAIILRILVSLALLLLLAKFFLNGVIKYRFGKAIFFLLAALAAAWLLAVSLSADPALGFSGSYERQQGLVTFIFYLLFFSVLIFQLKDFLAARRYLAAMLLSSFFVCLYGVAQVLNIDPVRWEESFWSRGRIFSTLGQPDFLGHFLILVIPFTVFAMLFLTRRLLARSMLMVLLFGQLFCLFFSYARSAWLGLAAEIVSAVIIAVFLRGRKKLAIGLAAFVIAASLLLTLCLTNSTIGRLGDISLSSRLLTTFDLRHGSVKARLNVWQAALSEIKRESWERRLVGYGPDELSAVFASRYQSDWAIDEALNNWPDRAHDSFLDIFLAFGLVGLAAYFLFFGYFFVRLCRFLRQPVRGQEFWLAFFCLLALIGYFVNNLFSFSDTAQFLYLYLILGLSVFLFYRGDPEKEFKLNLSKISRAAIYFFAVVLAGIFIFYYNWRPWQADYYYMRAVKNDYDCQTMLADARQALVLGGQYNLFYAEEYVNIGLRCFSRLPDSETRGQVRDNLLWCVGLLPAGVNYSYDRARTDAEAQLSETIDKSSSETAEKDFADLARRYPNISSVYEDWASFSNALGDYNQTIKIIGQGTSTLPLAAMAKDDYVAHQAEINAQLARFYNLLAAAYSGKNKNDQASHYYQKSLKIDPDQLQIYKKIADIYYQEKDLATALWYNKKGYALSPDDYVWPLSIGLLYREEGDKPAAIAYFEEALRLNPDNEEAKQNIGDLEK